MMVRVIFMFVFLIALPVMAQGDARQTQPSAQELFVQNSQLIEKTYDSEVLMGFKVRLPNDFIIKSDDELKNTSGDDHIYGELFHAYGATIYDLRPYFTVQSIELDRSISAENWLKSNALKNNWTIKSTESFDNGDRFEAFYTRIDRFKREETIKALGFLHQKRLALVEYVVPTQLFERDIDKQTESIKSFEFLNEFPVELPEKVIEYGFLDSFSMRYPQSWKLTRKTENTINRHDLSFKTTDINGFLFGEIDVSLISRNSLKDRVDKTSYPTNLPDVVKARRSAIEDNGYTIDPLMERRDITLTYQSDVNVTEVYPLRRKQSDIFVNDKENSVVQEFWMTAIKTPKDNGKNYIVTMLAPSRDIDFYQWALAVKSYEMMVQSLR